MQILGILFGVSYNSSEIEATDSAVDQLGSSLW
jgi:hypothetical protein